MEQENKKSSRPKARQSLAHIPSATAARVDRDNATTDVAVLQRSQDAQVAKRKLRGKSIGPGGLEALRETSGNAIKGDPTLTLKSILKPAIPLTPPKHIPSFDELKKRDTAKPKSPGKSQEDFLIDFSTPGPSRTQNADMVVTGSDKILNPFSPIPQQENEGSSDNAPSSEGDKEAELKRQAAKQAILDRRAARRKSLANRRVSFAPEATLHTWSVMELAEDSTASSASNSTRRQSSMTAQQSPNKASSSPLRTSPRRPTTPEKTEEPQVAASPATNPNLHQSKRRRTISNGPDAQLEGAVEDALSSSPADGSMTESSPVRIDDSAESESDDDADGDTAMSMDDATSQSVVSENSTSTQSSLDERLRQAATLAGTRGIGYDEHGEDLPMEIATATVTNAFQPWNRTVNPADLSAMQDQENVNPFSPAFKAQQVRQETYETEDNQDETQDMSMDVTHAVGGILKSNSPAKGRRKSVANRRRSSVGRRQSSNGQPEYGDETMDFTTMGGGILSKDQDLADEDVIDEDLSMEFTSAVGGVLGNRKRRESTVSVDADYNEAMDMTAAVGGILGTIEEQTEPQTDVEDDRTVAMDMTRAVGIIMPVHSTAADKTQAKQLMVEETSEGQLSVSPQSGVIQQGPVASIATETGSPDITLKPRLSGRSRQNAGSLSTTPKFSPKRATPVESIPRSCQSTPAKQITPLPTRAASPDKTPLSANVTHRGASPKKLFRDEIKARASPASGRKSQSIFSRDEQTGRQTPSVVLQAPRNRPQARRRSSGIGIDQQGYGSPQVTQLLDRRTSIGEAAPTFELNTKNKSKLRFQDPRELEQEVDAERADEQQRESGRFIMEQEANERQEENATLQLKEMIESMSPKKEKANRLKGRKSLAVGAARGLLGKRPAELDLDDEDGESTPKRLKTVERDGSPIKKVHLPKPPSKEETTGRLTRSGQRQLESLTTIGSSTPQMSTSPRKQTAASPHTVARYKDVPIDSQLQRPESFEDKMDNVVGAIDIATADTEKEDLQDDAKISLQEFLGMTNIHFIELNTTKRRHTMAQSAPKRPSEEAVDRSTEATFVAAATTLPLLELYQHATRELKSYINTGRKIIRTIEAETLAEQPPLFREYIDARADVKAIMDTQFKNGKIMARHQSKEGWYTWRAQLVEGLKNGLEGIKGGMQEDLSLLERQASDLGHVVPGLLEQQGGLEVELEALQQTLSELDSVDTDALDQARRELQVADAEVAQKTALLESLREQMVDKEDTLASAEELKTEMQYQIAEADRVRQEFRGWPVTDVLALKAKVDVIEKETGWCLASAEADDEDEGGFGVALTLMLKNQLRLFFYPSVYQVRPDGKKRRSGRSSRSVSGPNAPISLTYAPAEDDENVPKELSTEKRFFLQLIRSQLQAFSMMPKGSVTATTLLDTVSKGWDMACRVEEEIRLLNMAGITSTSILGDERLGVKVMLIGAEKGRIDVEFALLVTILNDGEISASSPVSATGIYGANAGSIAGNKGRKVQAALSKEVESKELGSGAWIGAIHGFEEWLVAQVQSEPKSLPQPEPVKEVLKVGPAPKVDIPPPTTKEIKRSPLAPKTANIVKKALPRPTKQRQNMNFRASQNEKSYVSEPTMLAEKENMFPTNPFGARNLDGTNDELVKGVESWVSPSKAARPAILPEEQERMMAFGTPVKRVGALRRSPM